MVSNVCRESCSPTMRTKSFTRLLNIDNSKDYRTPLHVETSVEYDLPAHIYPPKGAQPILMIHPRYIDSTKPKTALSYSPGRSPVSSHSLPLQVYNNQVNRKVTKTHSHSTEIACSCGVPNCDNRVSRTSSLSKQSHPQQSILANARKASHIYRSATPSKTVLHSAELSHHHHQLLQAADQQKAKYKQMSDHQNQLLHVQMQIHERKKLKARQVEHTQQQQGGGGGEVLTWNNGGRCMGSCCQSGISALPQAEFLAPGMPPSLIRTPTRGFGVSSPKLRARARRAINVASSINLPEYLGNARSSRNNSSSGLIGGIGVNHSFTRCIGSSFLTAVPKRPSITSHAANDVVRAQVHVTPQSMFVSSQLHKPLSNAINNCDVSSLVGQSKDSGCSLGADLSSGSATTFTGDSTSVNDARWWCQSSSWNAAVDSGFSTPVDFIEDQIVPMDVYDCTSSFNKISSSATPISSLSSALSGVRGSSGAGCPAKCGLHWMRELSKPLVSFEMLESAKCTSKGTPSASVISSSASATKDYNFGASTNDNLYYWMTDLATPLGSTSSVNGVVAHAAAAYFPTPNPHYIPPQPIWNLAY